MDLPQRSQRTSSRTAGSLREIHYQQPNSRISAGDPLPAAKQPDLCGRSTTSSRTAGSLREIHYQQPNSRISAGDPLPAAKQPDLYGRSTTSSRTAGSLREIHYQQPNSRISAGDPLPAAKQPDLGGRSTTSLRQTTAFVPLRSSSPASLRLFLFDSMNEVSLMRGPTGNLHQWSPPCGSEQVALLNAAQASSAPRDASP